MIIIHNIEDNLFGKNLSREELMKKLHEHWSSFGIEPASIELMDDNFVKIVFDDDVVNAQAEKLDKSVLLCQNGEFKKAEKLLLELTKECPLNSEAWRLLAQIHMQENKIDQCMDELISSLHADPKNKWALILMGNVLTRNLNKKAEAEVYYLTALKYYPDDDIALNNVAGIYLENEDYDSARPLFEKIIKNKPTYLNAYYGLALTYYRQDKYMEAFNVCHEGMLKGQSHMENPGVREELSKLYLTTAKNASDEIDGKKIWEGIRDELNEMDPTEIVFEEEHNSMVSAHLSNARTTGKGKHRVKYNPDKPYITHLFVHELTHLRMSILAHKDGKDMVLSYNDEDRKTFNKRFGSFFRKSLKNLPEYQCKEFIDKIHQGIGTQLMNCPLDLFVEEYIYNNYPMLRPVQLLSMFTMEQEAINAATSKDVEKVYPHAIVHANRVMNACTSMHLKRLYGLDFINYHKLSNQDIMQAKDLYEEYLAYHDYKPGEEYELCEYFEESLGLDDIGTMLSEEEFAEIQNREKMRDFFIDSEEEKKAQAEKATEANKDFAERHKDGADPAQTMMMQMYMLGAMEYLDTVDVDKLTTIAQEILITGTKGISPEGKYSIPSIPGKEFGGWQFLAYYYVSVKRAFPQLIDKLGLPFKTAYEGALALYNMRGKKK